MTLFVLIFLRIKKLKMTFINMKKSSTLLSLFLLFNFVFNFKEQRKNMVSQFYSTFLQRTNGKKSRNSLYLTH